MGLFCQKRAQALRHRSDKRPIPSSRELKSRGFAASGTLDLFSFTKVFIHVVRRPQSHSPFVHHCLDWGHGVCPVFLRPATASLEAPQRVRLMHEVLGRFFNAVLWAAGLTLGTGLWMIGRVAKQAVQSGGNFKMPIEWMVMSVLGVVMVLIFAHIRFALYKRLSRAVTAAAWPAGDAALASIRTWVMVNLVIGVAIVLVTQLGLAS